jgi:cytochrome P450
VNIQGLFIAGSDTTATTIRWALFFLANTPAVQKKCQEELDRVVGQDRLPSIELDKDK